MSKIALDERKKRLYKRKVERRILDNSRSRLGDLLVRIVKHQLEGETPNETQTHKDLKA